jgi:hypothetical protein
LSLSEPIDYPQICCAPRIVIHKTAYSDASISALLVDDLLYLKGYLKEPERVFVTTEHSD